MRRFSWIPINLSFSFTPKELRADPYTALCNLLGPFDIKILVDYVRDQTTHMVVKKRNTSKGLQALIDGKFIVHNDAFIQALVAAATITPPTEESGITQSPLEVDWEKNFPGPLEYLPPRGDEPTKKDSSAYSPDPSRQELFDGYIFIFSERRQFETLLAPITAGRGKALLHEVVPGQTEVNEFVSYVKSVAGEKGLGEFEDGSEGKGVVVVRFNPVKNVEIDWFTNFNRNVSLHLDHRLVEQNEFLDAILGNDASALRRPLELEASGVVAPPSTAHSQLDENTESAAVPAPPPMESSQPSRRGRSRRTVTTRFKGFDSDEDDPLNMNSLPENLTVNVPPVIDSQSQSLFVTQDPEMDIGGTQTLHAETQTRSSKKRNTPPINYELDDVEDIMEEIAPVATAMKKRRLAEDVARRRRGELTPPPPIPKEKPVPKPQPVKKVKVEVNVVEVARKQREEAEALARAEREALEIELDGMDIEAIRNLAIVEEMDIRRRDPPQRLARADESDRWDDKWNGRKNFKKFCHRGAVRGRRELGRVIVPLEEVKKKEYGIGDDYWLHGDSHNKKKKEKGRSWDAQDFTQTESQPSRPENQASTKAAEMLAHGGNEIFSQDETFTNIPPSADAELVETSTSKSTATSRSQKSQKLVDKSNTSSNMLPQNKRPASRTLTKPAPAKKAKMGTVVVQDSEDSDDDLKFKFRKRK